MTPPIRMVSVPVADLEEVRDLLMERRHGNAARSPAHNARLAVESMLTAAPVREEGWAEDEGRLFAEVPLGTAALYRDLENGTRPILATREEAPAEAGEVTDRMVTEALKARFTPERYARDYEYLEANFSEPTRRQLVAALRAQPPAREDAEPVAIDKEIAERLARYLSPLCFENRRRSSRNQHAANKAKTHYRKLAKSILRFPPIKAALTTPPAPDALRVAVEALMLFRAFVQRNVTQWKFGAGDHHHPMWGLVAEALGDENRTEVTSGAEWRFIQPENRQALAALQAEQGAK